jgi:hypothetical protein
MRVGSRYVEDSAGRRGFRYANAGATLGSMDAVRFGRALGFGARQAVKTLTTAVDAATAENPNARGTSAARGAGGSAAAGQRREAVQRAPEVMRPASGNSTAQERTAASTATRTIAGARSAQLGLKRESKRFGEAVWGPFVRLSGVVWLEVSGVFFGIFALFAGAGVWRLRGAWRLSGANGAANAGAHRSFEGAVVMLAVFGYFCASSFVRARRRERGR